MFWVMLSLSPCMARLVSLEDSMVSGLTRKQLLPQLVRLRVKPGEYMLKSPPGGSASSLQHQLTLCQIHRQSWSGWSDRRSCRDLSREILAGLAQSRPIQHKQTPLLIKVLVSRRYSLAAGAGHAVVHVRDLVCM